MSMTFRDWYSHVLVGLLSLVIVTSAVAEEPRLLWRLSGEHGLTAQETLDDRAYPSYRFGTQILSESLPGRLDQAVRGYREKKYPTAFQYRMNGEVCLAEGTLSLWFQWQNAADRPLVLVSLSQAECQVAMPIWWPFFRISLSPAEGEIVATFRDAETKPFELRAAGAIRDQKWHHLALTWDQAGGRALWFDGQCIAESHAPFVPAQALIGRLRFGAMLGGGAERIALDEVRIYGSALPAEAVRRLAEGDDPHDTDTPSMFRPDVRLASLGWAGGDNTALPQVTADHERYLLRQAVIDQALAYKNPAWVAVDGRPWTWWPRGVQTYEYDDGGDLRLTWAGPVTHLRIAGDFSGQMDVGSLLSLDLPGPVSYHAFDEPVTSGRSVLQNEATGESDRLTRVRQIDLFEFKPLDESPAGGRILRLAWGGSIVDPHVQEQITNYFGRADRNVIAAQPDAIDDDVTIGALRFHHIVAPPFDESFPLAAMRIVLRSAEPIREDILRLTLHHPVNRACEAMSADVRITGAGREVDLLVDCRDLMYPPGSQLWLTLVSRNGINLRADASRIELIAEDRDPVQRQYLAAQTEQMQSFFLAISEPRPWVGLGGDDSAARGAFDSFEELLRMLDDALRLAPDDRTLRALQRFTHPEQSENVQDALAIAYPHREDLPQWAVLQQAVLEQLQHQVAWWLENKLAPNGELGMGLGDDTCFYNDIGGLALIADPGDRVRDAVARLARTIFQNPKPHVADGLNVRLTDPLHAYEEGLNHESLCVLLDYGNPVYVERCMATADRYEWLFPEDADGRHLGAGRFNHRIQADRKKQVRRSALLWHPGLMLAWYNGHPQVVAMLGDYVRFLRSFDRTWLHPAEYGTEDVLFAFWRLTGDERALQYSLERYFDYARSRNFVDERGGMLVHDGRLWDYLDLPLHRDRTFESVRQDDPWDMRSMRLNSAGISDNNYTGDSAYVAWRLSGDPEQLTPWLGYMYRRLRLTVPVLTHMQMSTDRLSVPKHPLERMYLGGLASQRCMIWPHHAVSYEDLGTNFAALLPINRDDHLKVLLINTGATESRGRLRVWRLVPGEYRVCAGPDADGDGNIDAAVVDRMMSLKRYEAIDLTLPPSVPWLVEAELVRRHAPLHERPDLAVCDLDSGYDADSDLLTINVHNIGARPTAPGQVVVRDEAGLELARRPLPGIDPPLDLKPRIHTIRMQAAHLRQQRYVTVTVSSPDGDDEITQHNNEMRIAIVPDDG